MSGPLCNRQAHNTNPGDSHAVVPLWDDRKQRTSNRCSNWKYLRGAQKNGARHVASDATTKRGLVGHQARRSSECAPKRCRWQRLTAGNLARRGEIGEPDRSHRQDQILGGCSCSKTESCRCGTGHSWSNGKSQQTSNSLAFVTPTGRKSTDAPNDRFKQEGSDQADKHLRENQQDLVAVEDLAAIQHASSSDGGDGSSSKA